VNQVKFITVVLLVGILAAAARGVDDRFKAALLTGLCAAVALLALDFIVNKR
jgi:hypothetical protein